jgi:hypothetical protein
MHEGPIFFSGPIAFLVLGLFGIAAGLGVFVFADSFRARRRARIAELPEPWLLYPLSQLLYLVMLLVQLVPVQMPIWTLIALAVATPLIIAEQFAYLLRVVFPKPESPSP